MKLSELRMLVARVVGFFRRASQEGRLEAELRAHLAMSADENVRRGMAEDEARFAARREFGGVEQTREAYREQRGLPFLDTLAQDLRFTFRGFAARPGFAAIAVLT